MAYMQMCANCGVDLLEADEVIEEWEAVVNELRGPTLYCSSPCHFEAIAEREVVDRLEDYEIREHTRSMR